MRHNTTEYCLQESGKPVKIQTNQSACLPYHVANKHVLLKMRNLFCLASLWLPNRRRKNVMPNAATTTVATRSRCDDGRTPNFTASIPSFNIGCHELQMLDAALRAPRRRLTNVTLSFAVENANCFWKAHSATFRAFNMKRPASPSGPSVSPPPLKRKLESTTTSCTSDSFAR